MSPINKMFSLPQVNKPWRNHEYPFAEDPEF